MFEGVVLLKKLKSSLFEGKAYYHLDIGNDDYIVLNEMLGKKIEIKFNNEISCISCSRKIKKTFQQGYCYPCFVSLAECDSCMIKPEKCHYHDGTCRDSEWGERHCFQDHYIYIANTGSVKVGITRMTNVPNRWIDQGATQALPILGVKERLHSGLIEVIIKKHMSDKTNWRKMLKGVPEKVDLNEIKDVVLTQVESDLQEFCKKYGNDSIRYLNKDILNIEYPVDCYLEKILSHNLDKTPMVSGTLLGIKGQYLIFDTGVMNIRKFSGYSCNIKIQ